MKSKIIILIVLVLAVISLIGFSINAQKKEMQTNTEDKEKLMSELRKSVVGNIFYENLLVKETTQWSLIGITFDEGLTVLEKDRNSNLFLKLKTEKNEASIHVFEYKSVEEAKKGFSIFAVNQGRVEDTKEFGDEGRKIYRHKFGSLAFRKGRFYVIISCDGEEETAKRFAKYASDAIEGK
jgi:hypothetical protein